MLGYVVRNLARLSLLAAILTPLPGAAQSLARYEVVEIPPVATGAYVASVSMTVTPFRREAGVYRADYSAKVFPWFVMSEHGRLEIDVPDEALRQLEGGAAISFRGRAIRSDGEERPVDGRVSPAGPDTGKIKVRVFVSRRLVLVFDTPYWLPGSGPAQVQ